MNPTPTHRVTWMMSIVLLVLQVAQAILHWSAQWVLHGTAAGPLTTERVQHLSLWWVCAFGATALAMIASWMFKRWRGHAHAVAGAVWAMYSTELWFGTFSHGPVVPYTWAVAATALTGVYGLIAAALAEQESIARGPNWGGQ